MAILTDLPNELLLSIIADVSPLYIESFIRTCKRIWGLRADAIAEHAAVRSRLPLPSWGCTDINFLRCAFQDPRVALYPMVWNFSARDPWDDSAPDDLIAAINIHIQQNPYTALLKTSDSASNARDLVFPLLITHLLNLRGISIDDSWPCYMVETVSQIVEACHDPVLSLREPLALGRLTEVIIRSNNYNINRMDVVADLAVLFAMIPTLKKLSVDKHAIPSKPYSGRHQYHHSEVTDMHLDGCDDSGFLNELIRRTHRLQKFIYIDWLKRTPAKISLRLLIESLKQPAGDSLLYLSLLVMTEHLWPGDVCRDYLRNYNDLSLGSLREFTVLKTLVICVDMLIKTRGQSKLETGTGTVQRLISWLPASLEILVLHQGLEYWDKDTLRLLFRGLRNNKQRRIPNLRFINFVNFPEVDWVMPEDIKNACRATGIKIGYTTHSDRGEGSHCCRLYDEASNWEEYDWIESLAQDCNYRPRWRD